jgi:hypothetical protein
VKPVTFQLGLLICCIVCLASHAQTATRDDYVLDRMNGLRLSVGLVGRKNAFHRKDTMWIKVRLKNVGKSPITLYKNMGWGWSSSFALILSDSRGKAVRSSFLEDDLPYPPTSREDFVTIQPGETIEQTRDVTLKQYKLRSSRGYHLTVWYQNPVPRKFRREWKYGRGKRGG